MELQTGYCDLQALQNVFAIFQPDPFVYLML